MSKLSWTITVQVDGGAGISASKGPEAVEAIDRISVNVAPGDQDKAVEIQPGSAEAVRLLVIKSSRYDQKLSFTAAEGANKSPTALAIDAPQVFAGSGMKLFGVAPQRLLFTLPNDAQAQAADVEIFVARDATPNAGP
jgi:hypothetical protein